MRFYLPWVYLVVAAVEIWAEFTGNSQLRFLAKPLLMPVLMLWYRAAAPKPNSSITRLLLFAFAFSWVGDVALMFVFKNEIFFLVGLVGFLITHVLYAFVFNKVTSKEVVALLPQKWWITLPLVAYFLALVSVIFPPVPADMKVPVAVYSSVIAVMVIFALNRYQRVSDLSFVYVMAGALLFMFSDSLIAINKFVCNGELYLSGVWIMILYIAGQYLIAKGLLVQEQK